MTNKTFWRVTTLSGTRCLVPSDSQTAEIMVGYREIDLPGNVR